MGNINSFNWQVKGLNLMLRELRVENFAIIEKLTISFDQGLTVFTGETGAGKSIIIDAIGLLVGGRGSAEYVRHGEKKAEIEALFEIHSKHPVLLILDELGLEMTDDMLVLRRQISDQGKSVCRVNGKLVTLTHLREVGQKLIDIHGQHEHQELMHPENHRPLLDRFGGAKLEALKHDYIKAFEKTQSIYKALKKLNQNEQQIAQRIDLLAYQINEIKSASIMEDEEIQLNEERQKLGNFEKVYQALQLSYEALNGENQGLDYVRQSVNQLASVENIDNDLRQLSEGISNSFYLLEENSFALRDYLDQMEYQPDRLNEIEARLNELNMLKRKYGPSIDDVIAYQKQIELEYAELYDRDHKVNDLEDQLSEMLKQLKDKALLLSDIRKNVSKDLSKAINRELKDLYMDKAVIQVQQIVETELGDFKNYRREGIDNIEFLISTNPGEPVKPLVKIASGGEMSRIMLAIKSNFKSLIGLTSIIFDEVDTGVSGRVAQAMAEKIYQLAASSQVFCITHLPQVAAMSDHHLYISKKVKKNRTQTHVEALNELQKVNEVGRMISGVEVTDLTRQHAEELLYTAKEIKA